MQHFGVAASFITDFARSFANHSPWALLQAVVVSIDPKRVYVADPETCKHKTVKTSKPGPNGEGYVWWQCTIKGGREGRPLGAVELAQAVRFGHDMRR